MTRRNRKALVDMAREAGFSDADILKEALRGVYGAERRRLVVEWGAELGLDSTQALRLAHRARLIPTAHPPRGKA